MQADRDGAKGPGDHEPARLDDFSETIVPSDFFDQLIEDLDEPDPAPNLKKAAEHLRRTNISGPTRQANQTMEPASEGRCW